MNRIIVNGGKRLIGEVRIGGSKNAALPILFGGILTAEVCTFSELPRVSDVLRTLEILKFLGARIRFLENGDVEVDYKGIRPRMPPPVLTGRIRGSTYLLGAMLGRFGHAELGGVGGCNFGTRPIDQHLAGFAALGAQVTETKDGVRIAAPEGLRGTHFCLAMPSVGATANLMLAGVAASGEVRLAGVAIEPHVVALAEFLTAAGAQITMESGARLRIRGGKPLHGCAFRMIPDMIEAGTYLAFGVATRGRVTVRDVRPAHLTATLDTLRRMGVRVLEGRDHVGIDATHGYHGTSIVTGPYPAFPTDLHPQFAALFCLPHARGQGSVTETVWRERFRYTAELARMGAHTTVEGNCAHFAPSPLRHTTVRSPDLRGGAALLAAALATEGRSEIRDAVNIGRGYEHLGEKLAALGAQITVY
ncbi:MAG: UDP-N-acetylglucosamine 1-carboxyvinyltransferase [Clostridia bacterium]|nr:UDP-N-acetylglucosamine 1-carboxyvinyltransferase [Clostridia bacterium]